MIVLHIYTVTENVGGMWKDCEYDPRLMDCSSAPTIFTECETKDLQSRAPLVARAATHEFQWHQEGGLWSSWHLPSIEKRSTSL